ncbi:MAG: endo alpha-1,4 polygalactosaminidase [Akkermansiaceae bacterium]|nr:endo alpha-1,4 polygalactosaminidase [Armatimonadota bacterium]
MQTHNSAKRGFPVAAPWVSYYGPASGMGDLNKVTKTFRVINIDADPASDTNPDGGNFTRAQLALLKNGGRNRVISYLNIGSSEKFRTYWDTVPTGFTPAKKFAIAPYSGYPDEQWMDLGNPGYQNLAVNHVAARLAAKGVDGFYLDNMELVEHAPNDKNGPGSPARRQGGLDIVRKLREKYPDLLIVLQNATSDVTRLGTTGGVAFPSLLDGIAHEEVYAPRYDREAEAQLEAWRDMKLAPGGHPLWIATEDYVGSASDTKRARTVYAKSRAQGFSPYASDASAGQQKVFYWGF